MQHPGSFVLNKCQHTLTKRFVRASCSVVAAPSALTPPIKSPGRLINIKLSSCQTADSIIRLVHAAREDLDAIAVTAAISRLCKVQAAFDAPGPAASRSASKGPVAVALLDFLTAPILKLCTIREIATILQAVAKLRAAGAVVPAVALQPLLLYLSQSQLVQTSTVPRSLATVSWALAKLNATTESHPHLTDGLVTALAMSSIAAMPHFSAQDVATTLWAFSTWAPAARQPQAIQALCSVALKRAHAILQDFTPPGLALTVYAVAVLRTCPAVKTPAATAFLHAACQRLAFHMPYADSRTVASAVWSFAMLQWPAAVLFSAAAARALRLGLQHTFDDQSLSNMMWGFATAKHPTWSLFRAAGTEVMRRAATLAPQHIASLAWAFVRTIPPVRDAAVWSSLCSAALMRAPVMTPQQLSSTALAFATLQWYDRDLMSAIAASTVRFLQQDSPLAIREDPALHQVEPAIAFGSHLPYRSLAHMQQRLHVAVPDGTPLSDPAFQQASPGALCSSQPASMASPSIAQLSPQMLSNLLWAFAKLNHYDEALVVAAAQRTQQLAPPPGTCSGATSAASYLVNGGGANHSDGPVSSMLLVANNAKVKTSANLCLGASATVTSAITSANGPTTVAQASFRANPAPPASNGHSLASATDLCNLAWAFSILQLPVSADCGGNSSPVGNGSCSAAAAAMLTMAATLPSTAFTPSGLCQLYQAHTVCATASTSTAPGAAVHHPAGQSVSEPQLAEPRTVGAAAIPLHPQFLAACRTAWLDQVHLTCSSRLAQQVGSALVEMGLQPVQEVVVGGGMFSVDLGVRLKQGWVGVEVDGPSHFALNDPEKLLGDSVLRQHCLASLCRTDVQVAGTREDEEYSTKRLLGIIYVGFFAWKALAGSDAHQEFLWSLLQPYNGTDGPQ